MNMKGAIMKKKTVLIVGLGVQGSTVAKSIDENPIVSEIICADSSQQAVDDLVKSLKKGRGVVIDATDQKCVAEVAKGVDLLVNTMPFWLMTPTLDAAVEVGVNYMDFNAPYLDYHEDSLIAYDMFVKKYDEAFRKAGKTAFCGAGASPGLVNVIARHTMKYLDSCEKIMIIYHEGLRSKRTIPFWWSPRGAFSGMNAPGLAYIDGKLMDTAPYSGPVKRAWPELGEEVTFYEHGHPEPVTIGYHADEYYGGVKRAYFKYGGVGIEFSKPLYDLGLLSTEPEEVDGAEVIPFELIANHLPPAPRYKDDIQAIIDEGILKDNGAVVVESTGMKDGKRILVEDHVFSPGLIESFERSGQTSEMYQTGGSGAIFARMLLEEKVNQPGYVSADTLDFDQVDCFLNYANELGHFVETTIKEPLPEDEEPVEYIKEK